MDVHYYDSKANCLIHCDEMCAKYGTHRPIAALGIFPLSEQPDYVPVAFNNLGDGTWYPVESYTSMQIKAIQALVDAGLTEAQAVEALK